MRAQLAKLMRELNHAETRLVRLVDSLPAEKWPIRRDPDRWSVSECVAHLNLTSEAFQPRLERALAEARKLPRMQRKAYRRDLFGAVFGAMVGPLPSIRGVRIGRVKTTPPFVPRGDDEPNVLIAEFKRHQNEFRRVIEEGDPFQLDKVTIISPFGEKVRYNCFSALTMITRHEERHLQQAELVWR
jgi:hypothetical protein